MHEKKRYPDCVREDGNCEVCAMSSYGRDCRNAPINNIAYLRRVRGITQAHLADMSGINIRQIQKIESGEIDIGNVTLKTAVSLAKALDFDIKELIRCD